jgi:hypothetical protein
MATFLIILVLVFVGVDLLVRLVVDPLLAASNKKNKVSKSFSPRFDPTFKLATETMYDGGKEHDEEKFSGKINDGNTSQDSSENLK